MKTEDLCVAVDELLKMKKVDNILPGCFTKENIKGFKKTLQQKNEKSFLKEWKQIINIYFKIGYFIIILGPAPQNPAGIHQTQL